MFQQKCSCLFRPLQKVGYRGQHGSSAPANWCRLFLYFSALSCHSLSHLLHPQLFRHGECFFIFFLKEVALPIALAFCLASFLKPIYMPDGVCDYFLMWICVGLPFGIRRMCLWLVPSGYGISGSVGIFALNLIIGGLIGGLAFFIGLLLGIIHTIREII